jgi:hypothetical protein
MNCAAAREVCKGRNEIAYTRGSAFHLFLTCLICALNVQFSFVLVRKASHEHCGCFWAESKRNNPRSITAMRLRDTRRRGCIHVTRNMYDASIELYALEVVISLQTNALFGNVQSDYITHHRRGSAHSCIACTLICVRFSTSASRHCQLTLHVQCPRMETELHAMSKGEDYGLQQRRQMTAL